MFAGPIKQSLRASPLLKQARLIREGVNHQLVESNN